MSDSQSVDFDALMNAPPPVPQGSDAPSIDFDGLMSSAPAAAAPTVNHQVVGPSGDLDTDTGRQIGTMALNTAAGIASLPRAAAKGVDWVGSKFGLNVGADKALGAPNPLNPDYPLLPDASQAKDALYKATGLPEYQASTRAGRIAMSAIPAGLMALTAGPEAVVPAMVGGGASQAAAEAFPNHPMAAGLLGFLGGSAVASGMANTTARLAGIATGTGETTPLYQAYQRQGVPTDLTGDVTQSKTFQNLQAAGKRLPGADTVIADASQKAIDGWKQAAGNAAAKLGPAQTEQEAGVALQSAANDWLAQFKANNTQNWNAFRQKVPPGAPISVSNFQQSLDGIAQQWGGADNLAKSLQPQLAGKLRQAIAVDAPDGNLPWQAVQATRSRIGEMLESPEPIADNGKAALKQIYGALSNDMKQGADTAGAGDLFDKVNAYTRVGHAVLDDHIAPILQAPTPEQATRQAFANSGSGGTRLEALAQQMPDATQNLGAYKLREAASSGPGKFAGQVGKLSDEAQRTLFGPVSQDVQDLQDIGAAQKRTEALVNHSGTAHTLERGFLGRLGPAIGLRELGEQFGPEWGAAGFGAGLLAPNLAGLPARFIAANPAISRLYSTRAPVGFSRPPVMYGVPSALSGAPAGLSLAPGQSLPQGLAVAPPVGAGSGPTP